MIRLLAFLFALFLVAMVLTAMWQASPILFGVAVGAAGYGIYRMVKARRPKPQVTDDPKVTVLRRRNDV